MIRNGLPRRAATYLWVAAFVDVVAIALWLLALSGVLSPHPWVFMVLALIAFVLEIGVIAVAAISWSRDSHPRALTICVLLGGALPPILVLVLIVVTIP